MESQGQLFSNDPLPCPLAHLVRPASLEEFVGHKKIFERYKFLLKGQLTHLILWGPPGVGKTTLATLLAKNAGLSLTTFNAVLGGINDLKKTIDRVKEAAQWSKQRSAIFIDEIHRFNKAQQDALLPFVERGDFILIGATTENPRSALNKALLSRVQTIPLGPLTREDIESILRNISKKFDIPLEDEVIEFLADHSHGDARPALNALDNLKGRERISREEVKQLLLENVRSYDRQEDRHYDVISAFIKSMRGSDPQSALLWLAVMLDGGEDPVFIARRLVIFASEDVGNADPSALNLAVSTLQAVSLIGMPEARINLAQATAYLASTFKSNASYLAINKAMEYVANNPTLGVPQHLKSMPPSGEGKYLYPHSYPGHFILQDYCGREIPDFYRPSEMGKEKLLKDRLEQLWKKKN